MTRNAKLLQAGGLSLIVAAVALALVLGEPLTKDSFAKSSRTHGRRARAEGPPPPTPPVFPMTESSSSVQDPDSCGPETAFLPPQVEREPELPFCAEWNPDFIFNKRRCCARFVAGKRRRNWNKCAPSRYRTSYCGEMTPEQTAYQKLVESGAAGDVLEILKRDAGRHGLQAYCTVNNGFLSHGRAILPTPTNRVVLRSPGRCLNFATDLMAGLVEWTGRQIASQYAAPEFKGVHLLLGDVAAPRGGCLWGRGGRRGHASHTSGQDADIGFLTVQSGKPSPLAFHKQFDAKANWWLVKQFFNNPFACVKVIFLDRRHIAKLEKAARGDAQWSRVHRFLRHIPGHKNHFHVRIGDWPGEAGCVDNARPELEDEDLTEETASEGGADSSADGGDETAP